MSELADGVEDCVVQSGGFPRGCEALLVGLHVGKVEWVSRSQAAVHQFIARFEQQADALARADLEVMLAFGADVEVGVQVGLEDDLAAAQALHPKALGAYRFACSIRAALGPGARLVVAIFTLEPGHSNSFSPAGGCRLALLRP